MIKMSSLRFLWFPHDVDQHHFQLRFKEAGTEITSAFLQCGELESIKSVAIEAVSLGAAGKQEQIIKLLVIKKNEDDFLHYCVCSGGIATPTAGIYCPGVVSTHILVFNIYSCTANLFQ